MYDLAIKIAEYGIEKFKWDEYCIKDVLPILIRAYRLTNNSQIVLLIAKNCLLDNRFQSVQLLTSVASTYCDIGELKSKKTADYTYKLQKVGI